MLRTAREQAEVLLATASETGNGVLITVGVTAEDVLGAVRTTLTIWRTAVLEAARLLEAARDGPARFMEKRVHMSCMVVPMLVAFVFVLYAQRHLDWLEGVKARLGRRGTNLEGNVESKCSQKLKAKFDDAEHQSIPWMSQSCVRGHIWRYALAADLYEKGAVKRVRAGTSEVQSGTTPGMAYTVELGLKGNQKTFKSLVKQLHLQGLLEAGARVQARWSGAHRARSQGRTAGACAHA